MLSIIPLKKISRSDVHHCRIAIATGNVENYIQFSFFLHIDDTSENLHLRSGLLVTSNALLPLAFE
ncbi:MAG: hypothetical protein HC836_03405 [Richelia sp. RM2_1_2]|nr:hypothetical protein [Richelia sp. SM2_1_7]NJN07421.1 hypothetical protein [Richelia sp. RM1_1_1]NJO57454.1 hypothetical protein [Richelia sp. RM2_1_2]